MAEAIARVGIVTFKQLGAKVASIIVVVMATSCAAFAQHDHAGHAPAKALGEVQFETSCRPEAHKRFNQGMLYQHSFWYSAAKQAFEHALHADPACAIAYWGIAHSLLLNPFGPPPVKSLADGLAALDKGEGIAATEREKDFIRALKTFYAEHDKRDHRTRLQLYLKAMEQVAARYPQDDEAQIFYALALNVAASPSDKTYALPLKAAAILEFDLQAQAPASGRRPLPGAQLRLPRHRRKRDRSRKALCRHRGVIAARPAHAVPYFHPRRALAGIDRLKPGLGHGGEGRQGAGRSAPRHGLSRVRLFATRSRRQGARRP